MKGCAISRRLCVAAAGDTQANGATAVCASFSRPNLLRPLSTSSPASLCSAPVVSKRRGAAFDSALASCRFRVPSRAFSSTAESSEESRRQIISLQRREGTSYGTAASHFRSHLHASSSLPIFLEPYLACAFSRPFSSSVSSSCSSLTGSTCSSYMKTHLLHPGSAVPARGSRRPCRRLSASSFASASYSAAAPAPSAASSAVAASAGETASAASSAGSSTVSTRPAPVSHPTAPASSSSAAASPAGSGATGAEELQSFFARAELLVHLLHSRLALPLLYPFNSGGGLTHPLEERFTPRVAGGGSSAQSARQRQLRGDAASEEQQQRTAITCRWSRSAVLLGLAHVTPLVLAATKVANLLKIAHALSYYTGQTAAARQLEEQQRALLLASSTKQLLPGSAADKDSTSPSTTRERLSEGPTLSQQALTQAQLSESQTTAASARRKVVLARRGKRQLMTSHPFMRSSVHFLRPQLWRIMKPGDERRTKHLGWR